MHWDTLNAGANLFGEFQQKRFSVPARFLSFHPGQSHHFHPRHTFYKRKTCYDFWAQNQMISEIFVEFNWAKNTRKNNWIRNPNVLQRSDEMYSTNDGNLKAQSSFSLGVPADVTSIAIKNSWKTPHSLFCQSIVGQSPLVLPSFIFYLEINSSTFVGVKCPEDVLAKLVGISGREEHLVHLAESVRCQLPIGTILWLFV